MLVSNGRPIKTSDIITGNLVKYNEALEDDNIDLRKHILASWERCIESGLSPQDSPRLQEVSSDRLKLLIKKYNLLMKLAGQYITKMGLILPKNNYLIGLGDKEGILFYVEGNVPELNRLGYQPGYMHTEPNMGSNALGTCIYTREPTVILGSEHFLKVLKRWAGYAAPIHNMDDELEAVLMLMMPAELSNQNILGMVMVAARGIEKELRLIHEKSELANANEMLLEFGEGIINTASMLSHEIKNSLSNISAYIQLLQLERVLDNGRAEKILTEILRINKLLYDFKRLTKPVQMNFSRYSLNEILRSTIEIMKPKANMHKIGFNISIPEEPIYVKADKSALQQVFVNLIENAIQAMGSGGLLFVELKCIDESGDIVISFKDTGPGIPEEQINQIFKLFYTTKETGSGLGLSLCQSIIKYHGGEIKVHSVVGEGSTFTITLPGNIIK